MQKLSHAGSVRKISGTTRWKVSEEFYWWLNYERKDFRVVSLNGLKEEELNFKEYYSRLKQIEKFQGATDAQ